MNDKEVMQAMVAMAGEIGSTLGKLMYVTTLQTKAIMSLSHALRADPGISTKTKEEIDECLKVVDTTIDELMKISDSDVSERVKAIIGRVE